jgi:diguanylate cyclase (GGDEF)-like protein
MTSELEITATSGVCYSGSIDDLEARLGRGWRGARFDPSLRAEYDRETARSRVRVLRILAWFSLLMTPVAIWMDASTSPIVGQNSIVIRLTVLLPLQILGLVALRERAPVWLQGVAFVVPNVAASMLGAALGMLAPPFMSDAYIGMAISMPFIVNIMASPRPIEAIAYMLLVLFGVTFVCRAGLLGPPKDVLPALESSMMGSIMALAWVCRAELLKRRSFLHALIARIRGEELALANARLEALSNTDALTGVGNRRQFDDKLDCAWQLGVDYGTPLAVLMVDADHFKGFNDALGHSAGDDCLRSVAAAIRDAVAPHGGLVTRFGGEEFAVLLEQTPLDRASDVAEDIRLAVQDLQISHPFGPLGRVTVSIGVASCVPLRPDTPALLVNAADAALYLAKAQGRNRTVAADPASLAPPELPRRLVFTRGG